MNNDLQHRKLARWFAVLDADSDGLLEEKDLELAADRFSDRLGYAATSPSAQRLRELCVGLWRGLIAPMDADGDGKVTNEEMVAAISQYRSADPKGYVASIEMTGDQYFRMCDVDQDGWLDEDEWVAMFSSSARMSDAECRESFALIDRNSSGRVSREEFREAMNEFFTSDAPTAAGTNIFGRI